MKTDDLAALLASNAGPIDRSLPTRRYGVALLVAALGAALLMLAFLGVRPDIMTMLGTPLFWIKLAFPLSIAIGAFLIVRRLARPGIRTGQRWIMIVVPILAVWIAALVTLGLAPVSDRLNMVLGISWRTCLFNILYLAVPGFVAIFWAMKGMAPTRPRLAGTAAGLLASALATAAYSFHCPEMDVAFWAVWYVAGLLVPAGIGALLGPRMLRW